MLYPKIGIRPVIDGRWGGVRESLEKQTMDMAKSAARLISAVPVLSRRHSCAVCNRLHNHSGGAEAAQWQTSLPLKMW